MTKQPINPITSQFSNPFFGKSLKRRIGSPLYTTYKNGINELEERDRRCREEPTSKESRIFGDVFYLNMMRKELANEKLRSALCTISQSKYYRHDIKKGVKELQIKIARWDSDIARCIATDSLIDMYDGLAEWTSEHFEHLWQPFYYSVMQVLTRNGVKDAPVMAALECALPLYEYANGRLLMDIAQTAMDCPATKLLGVMVEEDIYRMADRLRTRLAGIVTGKDEEIDLNADTNVNTSGVNLLNALSNTEQMKGWLQDYFEYRDSAK